MSFNQSRGERTESAQYRKSGRPGSSGNQRNFSGKGGGTGPPPVNQPSVNSNRSFKKSNNAQGGQQFRDGGASMNPNSNYAPAARTQQNGSHLQSGGITVTPKTGMVTQESVHALGTTLSSQPAGVSSDIAAPATPAKAQGDSSKSFPLQFGSISPGFMNGMQVPARTNSAPPNLDEQKRAQARHDSARAVPTFPVPSIPRQQMPRKNIGGSEHSNMGQPPQISKVKQDMQLPVPPVTQTPKASGHPIHGLSMPMPFHQPHTPLQFGGPNSQIQSQGMTITSVPMAIGNASPLQQHLFFPDFQHLPMPPQGIMHQGPSLNFTPQIGPQPPPQLGNAGIAVNPQFSQQSPAKFGGSRKPVKITHPDTHEELRLDRRMDTVTDSASSGLRSNPNTLQSQPITSGPPPYPINYYNNFNPNSGYYSGPGSVNLNGNQLNPSSQAPKLSYPVSQGPATVSYTKTSAHNSAKIGTEMHGEVKNLEASHDTRNAVSITSSASVRVTKPAVGSHKGTVAESSASTGLPSVETNRLPDLQQKTQETISVHLQKGPETSVESSSLKLKNGPELTSSSLSAAEICVVSPLSVSTSSSSLPAGTEECVSADTKPNRPDEKRREAISRSGSIKDHDNLPIEKGNQVSEKSSSTFSQSLNSTSSIHCEITESIDATITTDSSNSSRNTELPTDTAIDAHAHALKTSSNGQGPNVIQKTSNVAQEEQGSVIEQGYNTRGGPGSKEIEHPISTQEHLERHVDNCKNDDVVTNDSVLSTSHMLDATTDNISSSSLTLSTNSVGNNGPLTLDAVPSRSGSLGGSESIATDAVQSVEGATPSPSIESASEPTLQDEGEIIGDANSDLESLSAAGLKDKPVVELGRSKSTAARGKKKMKEILQKADAAGSTSDLYMAYKDREGEKGSVLPESMDSTSGTTLKQKPEAVQDDVPSSRKDGQSKAVLEDWEDAADVSSPKFGTVDDGKQSHGVSNSLGDDGDMTDRKYSRDFLLKFSEQCIDLPQDFETAADIANALLVSNIGASRESYPSPGRGIERTPGGPRLDRRGSGLGDDDRWNKSPGPLSSGREPRVDTHGGNSRPGQGGNYGVLRNPRGQAPTYAGGILSGPVQNMGAQGGIQRNTPDSDRWHRATAFQKGLIPSPQTPALMMHKAEKRYEVGKVTDEEQAKQRQLKAILNKLTPQNFERLFEQVKEVNIDNAVTLTGVISQIFDKALMEPTFCEMYADFCFHLSRVLPDFSEDNEKITFKRLLLNKCQEEFERGEREQEEADRADEEGEANLSKQEREEKRIQVRRRMLGNIRLIGELYKKRMLTERIMHECIKKLLGQYQNPDEENIEALCKLMSTIGEMIDHPKAKEHMDVYFDMMGKLSNNMNLSSRVRFMLRDAIDLRKNKWQQRRKVEGPKKIDEVHRDAAQERGQASRMARGPIMNSAVKNRQPMDFGPRGSNMLSSPNANLGGFRGMPTQPRGFGGQDYRAEDRHSFENRTLSVPLRSIGEDSLTLGPQGGLARGMSARGQPSVVSLADAPSPGDSRRNTSSLNGYSSARDGLIQRNMSDRFVPAYEQSSNQNQGSNHGNKDRMNADLHVDRSVPASPILSGQGQSSAHNVSSEKTLPEERLREKSMTTIKEFYSAKDEKEVALCVKELNAPSFYPTMISIWVTDSFERKDMERDLLAKLLTSLSNAKGGMLSQSHLTEGFVSVLAELEDTVTDAPKAGEFLGRILARVVLENVVPFAEIGQLIYDGGEEQGRLVEVGLAAEVVGTILETIKTEKGDSGVKDIVLCSGSSGLKLEKFRPPDSKRPLRLDKFMIV